MGVIALDGHSETGQISKQWSTVSDTADYSLRVRMLQTPSAIYDPWKWLKTRSDQEHFSVTCLNSVCFVTTWWSDTGWRHCWQTFQAGFTHLQGPKGCRHRSLLHSTFHNFLGERVEQKQRLMTLQPKSQTTSPNCHKVDDVAASIFLHFIYHYVTSQGFSILAASQRGYFYTSSSEPDGSSAWKLNGRRQKY